MDLAGVLLGRRGPADDGLEHDERGLGRVGLGGLDRVEQLGDVLDVAGLGVPVDRLHLPAVGGVASGGVLAQGDVGVVLDRDLVRVVDRDQVAELLRAGERAGLAGHALLDIAVAGDHVDVVVEGAGARGGLRVEQTALVALRVGESDGGGESLAERAGRDLDALGVAVLGVAGGERAPGAQRLEVLQLEAVAAEVELHVLGQRAVARREDEAVASDPLIVAGVAAHDLLEEQVRGGGEADGRAGVAVADLLHGIRGEDSSRVNGLRVDGFPVQSCHGGV